MRKAANCVCLFFLIYYGVLRNSLSLNTKCFFPLKDCRTDTMCLTNSAARGTMFCLPLHGNAGNFSGFFWEGAEFNLHFVTSFHPIPTAVVSVNTGTPILLKKIKKQEKKDIGKMYLSNVPLSHFL